MHIKPLFLSFLLLTTCLAEAFYHTSGSRIVDDSGKAASFKGTNWFGLETSNFAPHGLWQRSMDDFLEQLASKGYNLLRIPYCNEMLNPDAKSTSINYYQNPDLVGLSPLQILDKLIEKAEAHGIKIILDRHRPTGASQSELWYTTEISEDRWIRDWEMLAKRYLNNETVIGADLHNEPHGAASWGTGDPATDWKLAAEKAGNAILAVNPNWLILVEGVERNVAGNSSNYWWGGNLTGVKYHPIILNISNRVVYSPHDYGPGVSWQPWFQDSSFPKNMEAIWDQYWGYISKQEIAPILIGEFGGRSVTWDTTEGKWQNSLVNYIAKNKMYWTYWCMNPNSGDTGGLLLDDWSTWNDPKQAMLDKLTLSAER